jgi:hypothetical protein
MDVDSQSEESNSEEIPSCVSTNTREERSVYVPCACIGFTIPIILQCKQLALKYDKIILEVESLQKIKKFVYSSHHRSIVDSKQNLREPCKS